MADTHFDIEAAQARHDDILRTVEHIRDGIKIDVIDYYYSRYPQTETEQKEQHDGMRKYLIIAQERIHDLLDGKLY